MIESYLEKFVNTVFHFCEKYIKLFCADPLTTSQTRMNTKKTDVKRLFRVTSVFLFIMRFSK